jgi:hypothetical protein
MANNNKGGMFDYVSTITKAYNDRQDRKFDNKYRQDVLNLKVSEAMRNQANLDRNYDYQTGYETIENSQVAGFLGLESGAKIKRSQLPMLLQKNITEDKEEFAKEGVLITEELSKMIGDPKLKGKKISRELLSFVSNAQNVNAQKSLAKENQVYNEKEIEITEAMAEMVGDPKLAGSKISREMFPLVMNLQSLYGQKQLYEDTYTKEFEKRKAATRDEMAKTSVNVPWFDTNELDDPFNINEENVRTSATSLLSYLNVPTANQITPLQSLTAKAQDDPKNNQVNSTISQLENIVKTMNMPGMRTGNIIPSWFGDKTEGDKNYITNSALQSLQELYKAKKMSDEDILKKIKVLKAKQPKDINLQKTMDSY